MKAGRLRRARRADTLPGILARRTVVEARNGLRSRRRNGPKDRALRHGRRRPHGRRAPGRRFAFTLRRPRHRCRRGSRPSGLSHGALSRGRSRHRPRTVFGLREIRIGSQSLGDRVDKVFFVQGIACLFPVLRGEASLVRLMLRREYGETRTTKSHPVPARQNRRQVSYRSAPSFVHARIGCSSRPPSATFASIRSKEWEIATASR